MRIGLDVHVLNGPHQGTVTVWTTLLEHLPPRHQYILYSYDPAATQQRFPAAHFEHRKIPVRNGIVRTYVVLPWLARRDRCDLLHVDYFGPLVGARVVVTLHDVIYLDLPKAVPVQRRLAFGILAGLTARRADRVIVVSEFTRARVADRFRVRAERMTVVHNALGDEWITPDEQRIDAAWASVRASLPERYVLSVGRWEARKNHVLAAQVAKLLRDEGLVDGIVVVGAADFGSVAMRVELAQLGLDRIVTSLSGVSTVTLQAIYRHASALLFLSESEGFGYPVVEAMAMGTPVVASNRGAIPEVCGSAGIVVNDLTPTAVHAATRPLLVDATVKEEQRSRGFERARHFAADTYARKIVSVYEEVGSPPEPTTSGAAR